MPQPTTNQHAKDFGHLTGDFNAGQSPTALESALEQNEAALDSVQQSATELVVINAVLKQEIPGHVQVGDVAQALAKTDALEQTILDAATGLAEVNETLTQEIDERADLERELQATKAALAREQAKP